MELQHNSQINSSTAKSNFMFSKDTRFKPLKLCNHMTAYTPKVSDFEKVLKQSGEGTRFGGGQARFDYYANRRKQGTLPSSVDHNSLDMITKTGQTFHKTNKIVSNCTFGQSRQNMKRLHVDAILEAKEEHPGPGQH